MLIVSRQSHAGRRNVFVPGLTQSGYHAAAATAAVSSETIKITRVAERQVTVGWLTLRYVTELFLFN